MYGLDEVSEAKRLRALRASVGRRRWPVAWQLGSVRARNPGQDALAI
jgi:hypothetical protein